MPDPQSSNNASLLRFQEYQRVQAYGREKGLLSDWCLTFNGRKIETLQEILEPHNLQVENLRLHLPDIEPIDLDVTRVEPYPTTWLELWIVIDEIIHDEATSRYLYIERLIDSGYGDFELQATA